MALECSEGAGSWSLAKDISSGIRSYIALLCCPIYPTLVFDPTDPGQGCWVNVILHVCSVHVTDYCQSRGSSHISDSICAPVI